MSSIKYDVEKFCGKRNFSLWQRRMKDLLIQQGVHKALLGKEKKPKTMKNVEWVEMDEKAASAIRFNLGDEVIHNILEAKTAKEVWEKLEGLYMRKNLTNKLYVKKQLYSSHIKEASLPTSFDNLVTTLMYEKETIVLEEVTSALLSYIKMKQDGNGSQADGLIVKFESNNRGRSRSRGRNSNGNRSQFKSRAKKDVEYYYCHKKGYYKNQCKELKEHLEEKKNGKKPLELASVAEETSDDSEVCADLLSVSSDSACSYHITLKKDWFDTYKPYNGDMVQMGNDATCLVIGIGTVKIKMFDGVVRVLSNVRYVLDLRKNLRCIGIWVF
ncbi:hypothetical protein ACB092_06G208900 [Castanea dentata]